MVHFMVVFYGCLRMCYPLGLCSLFYASFQKEKIFSQLGTRTLGVYVFHYNFINLFVHSCWYKALYHNFPNTWEIILVLLGIVVTLICCLKPFDAC